MNWFKYFLHFVDSYSRFSWVYMIAQKSHALNVFLSFKMMIENQRDVKNKLLQTDNGGDFKVFKSFF